MWATYTEHTGKQRVQLAVKNITMCISKVTMQCSFVKQWLLLETEEDLSIFNTSTSFTDKHLRVT